MIVEALIQALGHDHVLTAPADLEKYSRDATAGLHGTPAVVVFPGTTEEVAAVVMIAREHRVPIVTRGAGTGLSGGCVPSPGSIVLCLVRMNRILEVDERNFTLRAEAGATTQAVADAAEAAGLFYPPDPGSIKECTIGGNVAENAGGLRGLKYGVTGDYVLGLEVVLANGEVLNLGNKCVKDVAGYDLKSLILGSEGTLGIVTQVLLKLLPKPAARKTLLALYPTLDEAAFAASEIITSRIVPCTLEFLDKRTLECIEAYAPSGLPTGIGAMLLIEVDGHPVAVMDEAEQIRALCASSGATSVRLAATDEEASRLTGARRLAFTALAAARPTAILEDATVPRSALSEMVRFVQETARRHRLDVAVFGHFGDGNLHPTFLTDESDADEMKRIGVAKAEIFERAIAHGGTISGEHGVGLSKRAYLRGQVGEATLGVFGAIKAALDPLNLLNPAKALR